MKTAFIAIILIGLLSAVSAAAVLLIDKLGDVQISLHGMIALGLGIAFTLAIGIGLMFLVFYSSRKGFDEKSHNQTRHGNGQ